MDFGQFISSFQNIYQTIRDVRKLEADEPLVHNKKSSCRELLCQIAENENMVLYPNGDTSKLPRSLKTFEAYYRNGNRRSLHPIAVQIRQQLDLIKFMRFLHSMVKHSGKEQLKKNFQAYLPGATLRSILGDITRAFVDILREASDIPDRRYKLPVPEIERLNESAQDTNNQVDSSGDDSERAGFNSTYKKGMTLSNVNSGIRAEIWKTTDEIINACKRFKFQTNELYHFIGILDEAKNKGDQVKFDVHFPKYILKQEETEDTFRGILKKWGHLYTTFSNIIEVQEITQMNFAHSILLPPDNKTIHVACDETDAFIERLRQLSEDYLFT